MGSLGEGAARGRLFNPRINFRAVGRIHEDATAAPTLSQSAFALLRKSSRTSYSLPLRRGQGRKHISHSSGVMGGRPFMRLA